MSKKINLKMPGKVRPNLISLFKSYLTRKVREDEEKWEKRARMRHRYDFITYSNYDDEYAEEMEQLRRFYGGCFPHSSSYVFDEDEDDYWDDDDYDDYYVGDDGEIIFPPNDISQTNTGDLDRTLRPGEYRRSRRDMDDYWNRMSKLNDNGKKKHTKHRGSRGSKKAKVIDIDTPYDTNYIDDGDVLSESIIYFYEDYHDKNTRIEFNNLFEFDEYCREMGLTVPSYVAEQIAYSPISYCCLNPTAKDGGVLEVMREETYADMFYEACETSELNS